MGSIQRLVKILKPKLSSDLRRRKSKAQLLSARIDLSQRSCIGLKAELDRRHCEKLHVCLRSAEGKGRSSENFPSRGSDAATNCIQRVTEGKRICKCPYCNRLPYRNIHGGSDWSLRHTS